MVTKNGWLVTSAASVMGDHPIPHSEKEAQHDSFRAFTIYPRTEELDPGRHRGAHRSEALLCVTARTRGTIPSLATLEKFAQALEVPLYHFFYDGKEPPKAASLPHAVQVSDGGQWGLGGESARYLHRLGILLGRISEIDRKMLMHFVSQLTRRKKS